MGVREPRVQRRARSGPRDRDVGRLLTVPASTCPDCGSRVLELLYCYECGDVSLGGYVVTAPGGWRRFVLGPTAADIPALEAQPVGRRRHGQYMWYWPATAYPAGPQLDKTLPNGKQATFGFRPGRARSRARHALSRRQRHRLVPVGLHEAGGPEGRGPRAARPLPAVRPAGLQRRLPDLLAGRGPQPDPGHTTGIAQSTQLYLSQLVRSMGDTPAESRTIVFTDSRDDAARTAAGSRATTSAT